MGFKLDDMIGKYKDFARGYLFYARVMSPFGIDADHSYLVSSAKLPTQTIEPLNVAWQGNQYNFAGVTTFETFDITFKCDTAQQLRYDFLSWMQQIHDPVSNVHGNPATYMGQVDMTQLNGQGTPVMSYSLVRAFPTSVGEVSLDYSSKEISSFTVTFTYQYHLAENIFDGAVAATPVSLS